MTNGEKYKTAQERAEAFRNFCNISNANNCGCRECYLHKSCDCNFAWLDLEAEEEKPLPCPFCGKPAIATTNFGGLSWVQCADGCGYSSTHSRSEADAIAAHNRVAKAVNYCSQSTITTHEEI